MDILTIPKYIQWYITNDCNSNCIHCNVIESSLVKHRKKLTLKQNHKVIDNIDYPNSVIEILGGEPLCYNGLNEILNHIKQNKFRAYLVSNGVLLSPCAKTRQILYYCDEISISVDGIIAESYKMMRQTNNFNTVIKNLTYCVDKLGADKLTVIYVVAKPTMNEPEKIIDFFRSLGVKKITFNTLQKTLRSDSFSKELYIDLEEHLKFFEKLALATHKY
ncbi:MAG: radical SAM protein, partial [Smithella sp.]